MEKCETNRRNCQRDRVYVGGIFLWGREEALRLCPFNTYCVPGPVLSINTQQGWTRSKPRISNTWDGVKRRVKQAEEVEEGSRRAEAVLMKVSKTSEE